MLKRRPTKSHSESKGHGRKDDQGRADRKPDPPPSLAARNAGRVEAQQDRPGHRAAGYSGGARHDREGPSSRSHRRREVIGRMIPKSGYRFSDKIMRKQQGEGR